jgi:hypothetical protein
MTFTTAVDRLWQAVHQLRDDVQALRLHALEDRPVGDPSKLIDDIGMSSLTLAGWVEEALNGAAQAVAASGHPADPARLRLTLSACAEATERAAAQLTEELTSTRRLDELTALGREDGRERRAWIGAMKQALDCINPSMWAVQAAVTDCWRELAERAPGGDLSALHGGRVLPAAAHDAPQTGSERRP